MRTKTPPQPKRFITIMSDHSAHDHDLVHDQDHSHDHDHGHGHHHHVPKSFGKAFAIGITLNTIYVIAEVIWGIIGHSLALLADACHNLSDILALVCAWVATILSQKKPSAHFTYGYRRTSILASLANAIILLIVTGGIILEAIERFSNPVPVQQWVIIIVAAIGVVVNGATAMMFVSGQKEDLNIKGAFLHMTYDALLSLSVVIVGITLLFTQLYWLDPAISLFVSVIMIIGTWSLLKDSVVLAMDGVPNSINPIAVETYLRSLPNISDLHDLHIWAMSTTDTALTVHLVSDTEDRSEHLLHDVAKTLKDKFKISHATFQIEHSNEAQDCILAPATTI